MDKLTNELYADLCERADIARDEQEETFAAATTAVSPVIVAFLRGWVLSQFKRLACENRSQILAAVDRWLQSFIKDETLRIVLANVAETVAVSLCPQ